MMADFVKEQCCSDFFTLEFLIGRFGVDTEKMMAALGKALFVPAREVGDLYKKCMSESVSDIRNDKDYFRYCREKIMLRDMGEAEDPVLDEMITVKGEAIAELIEAEKDLAKEYTSVTMKKVLIQAAAGGNVRLMKLVGLLMSEGIFFGRDREAGLRLISKAADWNDIGALMMKIYYLKDGDGVKGCLDKLAYLLSCHNLQGEIRKVGKYAICDTCKTPKEAALLEKLFAERKLERGRYSVEHARVIFSEVLSFNDKCQALAADKGDGLNLSELPLGLKDRKTVCREDIFGDVPVVREKERKDLVQAIRNADLRARKVYRPLLLTSASSFLLELYTEAVEKSLEAMNVVKIEVSELNATDFEASQNNVLVRFCDENCDNAYMIFFRGKTSREMVAEMKEFLRTESRAVIRLNHPSVTLDMRLVLPVVIADAEHAALLADACEVVKIEDVKKEEMPALLDAILKRKAAEYGVVSVCVDNELKEKLLSGKLDDAVAAVDYGVRKNRIPGEKLTLTAKDVAVVKSKSERRLGFGGTTNEN